MDTLPSLLLCSVKDENNTSLDDSRLGREPALPTAPSTTSPTPGKTVLLLQYRLVLLSHYVYFTE